MYFDRNVRVGIGYVVGSIASYWRRHQSGSAHSKKAPLQNLQSITSMNWASRPDPIRKIAFTNKAVGMTTPYAPIIDVTMTMIVLIAVRTIPVHKIDLWLASLNYFLCSGSLILSVNLEIAFISVY
jgi:hypothetical protein